MYIDEAARQWAQIPSAFFAQGSMTTFKFQSEINNNFALKASIYFLMSQRTKYSKDIEFVLGQKLPKSKNFEIKLCQTCKQEKSPQIT